MPTVTVQAPDSALAMDEVIRQLGDNAYIVSTNTRDGQVEILATTEPAKIIALRKREPKARFAEVIMQQVNLGAGAMANISPIVSLALGATDQTLIPTIAPVVDDAVPEDAEGDATSALAGPSHEEPPLVVDAIAEPAPAEPAQDARPGHESELRDILRQLSAQLARIEATAVDGPKPAPVLQDPIETAGFPARIIGRLLSGQSQGDRATAFATAMAKAMVVADPSAHLRAPAVVIVGQSGSGKTVLSAKIAALALETQPDRRVELVSLSGARPLAEPVLPAYARALSCTHRTLPPDQIRTRQMSPDGVTHVFDSNLDPDDLEKALAALGDQFGRDAVVIVALPAGSSLTRIRAELGKYSHFKPDIALTKLDECELSPEEASEIADIGTRIAWISGTSSLTDTIAPATEETIFEFLTGLLTVKA
jgi:hypothetical protein